LGVGLDTLTRMPDLADGDAAAAPSRLLPQIGELFGRFRILRELGRGGMGAVYEAEEQDSGRRVALKVIRQQIASQENRARFLREGRLAASINHPNSVYVYSTEEIEGAPAIAMELVAGGTLQERVNKSGPLAVPAAVDAILQIIAGLESAQRIGILHRDIKPSNCFLDTDGTVKIGDFGLSISAAARADANVTASGTTVGTPAFCSPEQLRGEELNARSDQYSVGGTLFYLLTGRAPFEGHNGPQLIANVLEKFVQAIALGSLSRLGGAVFGVIKTAFILSFLMYVIARIEAYDVTIIPKEPKSKSKYYAPIEKLAPNLFPFLREEKEEIQKKIISLK